MVLQPNGSKRVNDENAVPRKKDPATTRIARTGTQATSSRNRAHANGTRSRNHQADQAKKRSNKSSTKKSSAPGPSTQTSSTSSEPPKPPLLLPTFLTKPETFEVPDECMVAVGFDQKDMDPHFIRNTVANKFSEDMHASLRIYGAKDIPLSTICTLPNLPNDVTVTIDPAAPAPPSHMLAVSGPRLPGANRQMMLYPAHGIILAINCARLPPFSPPGEEISPGVCRLPVYPLLLPAPKLFPLLLEYLYLGRIDTLFAAFTASVTPKYPVHQPEEHEAIARELAITFSPEGIFHRIAVVYGTWQNMCQMGIHDPVLWSAIDAAWSILLMTLAICTGKSHTIPFLKASVSARLKQAGEKWKAQQEAYDAYYDNMEDTESLEDESLEDAE